MGAWTFSLLPDSPAGPLTAAVVFVVGCYLATVRLVAGADRIVLGQGPWQWPRRVIPPRSSLMHGPSASAAGGRSGLACWSTTRMTVRPGPTLVLAISTGEYIRISTPDPVAAVTVIRSGQRVYAASQRGQPTPASQMEDQMTSEQQDHRPWYGPKRIGSGVRPQTWQGWLILLAPLAVALILAAWLG
jgi:hypothetical protein